VHVWSRTCVSPAQVLLSGEGPAFDIPVHPLREGSAEALFRKRHHCRASLISVTGRFSIF
jgi:hypothetical protein